MIVEFWGVRGSHGCWGPDHKDVGGHTSCVSIKTHDHDMTPLILDAGSGIIPLGETINKAPGEDLTNLHCFISHPHLDHLQGVSFFKPLWGKNNHIHFYQGDNTDSLKSVLQNQLLSPPLFPIPYDQIPSTKSFHRVSAPINIGDITVTPVPLNHPGGATGYVMNTQQKKVVYITDHEHFDAPQSIIDGLINAASDADLIIFDTMYDVDDIHKHRGWGHSSWKEACDFARDVNAKALALFHHNPAYNDKKLLDIEQKAKAVFPGAFLAREGMKKTI